MNSITFGEGAGAKNTWTDWGLALLSQPDLPTPPLKTKLLESEGMDGEIDLTTAITGYPVFGNRKGRFKFAADLRFPEWQTKLQDIKAFLHGQYMRMRLSDDPGWYWEGRFTVEDPQARPNGGTLAIAYSVGPYKWAMTATDEPWLWDPFSFVDGVIGNGTYIDSSTTPPTVWQGNGLYSGLELTTTARTLSFSMLETGTAPQQIGFTISNGENDSDGRLSIRDGSMSFLLPKGETTVISGLVLYRGEWLYQGSSTAVQAGTASGTTYLTMDFRRGML